MRFVRLTAIIGVFWFAGALSGQAASLAEVQQRAEQGDSEAQNSLGNLYTNGNGVAQDFAQAFVWYQRAASKGFAPAQFNLGLAHELGRGTKVDEKQAFKAYLLAAEQGFAAAQFNIGNMYAAGRGVGQDFFEANLWFKQAADKGVIEAQYNLGLVYEAGRGVKKDEATAARWYRAAADQGFARAQYNLGLLYEDGRGVKQDDVQAAQLYRAAAEQGFAPAQNNLGLVYVSGRGVPADPVTAYAWLALAVKNGANQQGLDYVSKSLTRAQIDQGTRRMAELIGTLGSTNPSVPSAVSSVASSKISDPATRGEDSDLEKIRAENARLLALNQQLLAEKTQLGQQSGQGDKESAKLVEQLRGQSARLSDELQKMVADREAAALRANYVGAQLKGAEEELSRLKAAVPRADQASEVAKLRAQASAATSRADDATKAVADLRADNQRLQDENSKLARTTAVPVVDDAAASALRRQIAELTSRLEATNSTVAELRRKNSDLVEAAAQSPGLPDRPGPRAAEVARGNAEPNASASGDVPELKRRLDSQENIIRSLRSDNQRLNDEVKNSTRELLSLNQQLRSQRDQSGRPAAASTTPAAAATRQLDDLRSDNQRVSSNNARLKNEREAAVNDADTYAAQLRDARNEIARLTIEVQQLRGGRSGSDVGGTPAEQAAVQAEKFRAENAQLSGRIEDLSRQLTIARSRPNRDDTGRAQTLDQELTAARAEVTKLSGELQAAAADRALVERLKSENADLDRWAKSLEAKINDGAAGTSPSEAANWRSKFEAAQANLQTTTAQLAEAELRRQEINRARLAAEERTRKAEETLATRKEDSENRAARSEALVRQLGEDNARLTNEAKKMGNDVLNLRRRLQETASITAKTEPEPSEPSEATKALQAQLAAAEIAATDLRARLASAQTDSARSAVLAKEKETLTTQLSSARQQNAMMAELLQNAQKQNAQLVEAGKAAADLRAQLDRAVAENRELSASRADLERASAAITQLTHDRDTLVKDLAVAQKDTAQVATLRDENSRLKQIADGALSKGLGIDQLTAENSRLKETEAKIGATVDTLRQQLAAAQLSIDQGSTNQAAITAERDRLAQALATARNDAAQLTALREENSNLKQAAGAALLLRTQVDQLSGQLTDSKQQASALGATEKKLAAAERAAADLRSELERAQTESRRLASLTRDNEQLAGEIRSLKEAGAKEGAGLQAVRQQLAAANQSLDQTQSAAADLSGANERLERELATAKQQALQSAGLTEELARLRPLAAEVTTLRQDLQQLERAAAESNNLRQQNDRLAKDNERLTSTAKAAESTQVTSLREENSRLKQGAADAQDVRSQVAQLTTQLAQTQATSAKSLADAKTEREFIANQYAAAKAEAAQLVALREENSRLKQDAVGAEDLRAQASQLAAQLKAAQSTNSKDSDVVTDLQRQLGEVQQALAASAKSLAEAKTEREFVANQYAAAKAEAAQLVALREENSRLKQEVAGTQDLRSQASQLAAQLKAAQSTNSNDSDVVTDLQRQLGEVQQALASSAKSLADAKTEKEFVANQYAAAKAEAAQVVALREENSRLKQDAADAQELRGQVTQLTARLENAQSAGPKDAEAVTDLQRQLGEAQQTLAANAKSLADAKAERDFLANQLTAARGDTAQLAAAREEISLLKNATGDSAALQTQLNQLLAENERLQSAKPKDGADVAALRQQVADAGQALEQNRTIIANLNGELDRLTRELASSRQANTGGNTLGDENARLRQIAAQVSTLRADNIRLERIANDARNARDNVGTTISDLGAERDRLAKELAAAKQDAEAVASLQTENAKLKSASDEAVALRSQFALLTKEAAQQKDQQLAATTDLQQRLAAAEKTATDLRALAEKNQNGGRRVTELANSVEQLTAENKRLKDAATKTGASADALRFQLSAAQQALIKSGDTAAGVVTERDRFAKELAAAKREGAQLAALRDENAKLKQGTGAAQLLRTQVDQLTAQVAQFKTVGAKEAADAAALRQQLAASKQSVDIHSSDLAQLTAERDRLAKDLATAKQVGGAAPLLRTQVDQLTAQVAQLKAAGAKEGGDAEALRRQLTAANQTIEKSSSTMAAVTAERDRLASELSAAERNAGGAAQSLRAQVEQLTAQVGQLKAAGAKESEEASSLRLALARLAQSHESTQSTLAKVTTERDNLAKGAGNDEELRRQLTAAQASLKDTRAEKDLFASELAAVKRDVAQLTPMREENNRLKQDAGQALELRSKVTQLTEQLKQLQAAGAQDTDQVTSLRRQLAESGQLLDRSQTAVAELTGLNDRLEKDLATAKQLASTAGEDAARARQDSALVATLRSDNLRLERAAVETTNLRQQVEQLTRENQRLAGVTPAMQRDLDTAREQAADLQKQIDQARAFNTGTTEDSRRLQTQLAQARQDAQQRATQMADLQKELDQARSVNAAAASDELRKLRVDMAEANSALEKHNATVAELTGANDRLEKDLENTKKSLGAALAAQSQAVNANQSDAYKMEIRTLQDRVKQVESTLEEDRSAAAREISTIANQLQKSRETNQSLVDANRSLVNAKRADDTVGRSEYEQAQAQVRDLTSAADELRRQIQRATDDAQRNAAESQRIAGERDGLKSLLADARKVATTLPGLADEKVALEERLKTIADEVTRLQGINEQLRRQNSDTSELALLTRQAADRSQTELASLRLRLAEAEKASDSHNISTAELTVANQKLEQERTDLRRQLDAARADAARFAQAQQSASQAQQSAELQRTEAERNALQSVDAVTTQMAQLRRDVDGLRATNARLTEANATQDRDRQAVLAQLRAENTALNNRLAQAQGTLDQIASAARLGTPGNSLAGGGSVNQVSAPAPSAQQRFHTVESGDSLSRISLRYYGTANRWQEIYNANRDVLQGSSALRVGQQLRIP